MSNSSHGGILDGLDAEQRLAAMAASGPVCIIAGAGTGKTRTVTHRLAHAVASGAIERGSALAVTHTAKAAAELQERLVGLGLAGAVDARTFHAAGLRIASKFWSRTGLPGEGPVLLTGADEWRTWLAALRAVIGSEPVAALVTDTLNEVNWARSRLLSPEQYADAALTADRNPGISLSRVVDTWARVEEGKQQRGLVDFADLLAISANLLETDDDVASQVRRRWAHLTVDEYQDTDRAQQRLLNAILGKTRELCVVGDPRQAIYSFKGGDTSFLTGFTSSYPDAAVIKLVRNYRSSPQVLAWANRVAVTLGTKPLVATRPGGPEPTITRCEDERAETSAVVRSIRRLIGSGTALSEIAILYRFNSHQARFEAALTKADIATTVAEDKTFFERDEIRQAMESFARAANRTPQARGLDILNAASAAAGFNVDTPPDGQGAVRARWESQRSLLDVATSLPHADSADAASLHGDLAALASQVHGPRTRGVTLATLHSAKGLEWDVVFIVSAVDGVFPAAQASGKDTELAEEERLVHVAVTRARRELHLTWPATNARGWNNKPSPFLAQLSPAPRGAARQGTTERRPANAGRTRSTAECPHCTDPLKGISARRLGVCGNCVISAPGPTGQLARALDGVVQAAAARLGVADEDLLSRTALLRLLDAKPNTVEEFAATPGVSRPSEWAAGALEVMRV